MPGFKAMYRALCMDIAYEKDEQVKAHFDQLKDHERHYGSLTSSNNPHHLFQTAAYPESQHVISGLKNKIAAGELAHILYDPATTNRDEVHSQGVHHAQQFIASRQLEIDEAHKRLDGSLKGFEEKFFASEEGKKFQETSAAKAEAEAGIAGKAKEILSDASKMSGGKKLAIAAAVTAVVAVIGGWVWKTKHQDKVKSAAQEQSAAR